MLRTKHLIPKSKYDCRAFFHENKGTGNKRFSKKVMLMGPPGVGKGTYASRASKILGIPHIAAGDFIREEIKAGTEEGVMMQKYTNSGRLVPDDIVIGIVFSKILKLQEERRKNNLSDGFLLDGFPRTIEQATEYQKKQQFDVVINLQQDEEIIVKKLSGRRVCSSCGANYNLAHIKRGGLNMPPILPKVDGICDVCGSRDSIHQRPDDREDVVQRRLKTYRENTKPLIQYYSEMGVLRNFQVCGGADELLPAFLELLKQ